MNKMGAQQIEQPFGDNPMKRLLDTLPMAPTKWLRGVS